MSVDPHLTVGTFEPGMLVNGKQVKKWHTTNTVPFYTFNYCYTSVCVEFSDGSKMYVQSVRKL